VPRVVMTENLRRLVDMPLEQDAEGETARAVLEDVFTRTPSLRGYVLDDQGALRKHVVIFIDGVQLRDRSALTDRVPGDGELYVMQALSGG
jgi:sulfur-carrier protein